MRQVIVIAHNLRSSHNVGSILRTAECLGTSKVYLTGYTPYPHEGDSEKRLPHTARKLHKQIEKTALGAQDLVEWEHFTEIGEVIVILKKKGYTIAALEQTDKSVDLAGYEPPEKLAIIVGREVEGLEQEVIELSDEAIEIPMRGEKKSLNVCQAAAIVLYNVTFYKMITAN